MYFLACLYQETKNIPCISFHRSDACVCCLNYVLGRTYPFTVMMFRITTHTLYEYLQPVAAQRFAYLFVVSMRCLDGLIVLCLNNFASGMDQETTNTFGNNVPLCEL
jgi:hypothetical protein